MYIASFAFGIVGCIIAANAKTIGVLIGMRVIQAAGCAHSSFSKMPAAETTDLSEIYSSSSVLSMGAATLSDLYDPQVRGTMMGIFYSYVLCNSVCALCQYSYCNISQRTSARTRPWSYHRRCLNTSIQLACNILVHRCFLGALSSGIRILQ